MTKQPESEYKYYKSCSGENTSLWMLPFKLVAQPNLQEWGTICQINKTIELYKINSLCKMFGLH